ncbi:unnamed protein product [Absidia cylindrospora]
MVRRTKNKPWKLTLLCVTALIFTLSLKAFAQDSETTQLQQNVLQSQQPYEAHDEEDHSKRGQVLYYQALERLEPLVMCNYPARTSKTHHYATKQLEYQDSII